MEKHGLLGLCLSVLAPLLVPFTAAAQDLTITNALATVMEGDIT